MNLIVFVIAAIASYWYETELLLFFGGVFIMARFLYKWYKPVLSAWPPDRGKIGRSVLGVMPVTASVITLFVLLNMASFDVVGIWIVFYIIMGYAWINGGVFLIEYLLDFSWAYDTIHLDNKAAVIPAASSFLGLTLIYAGANIGDGPGWWVILIAGGLGFITWLCLALLLNLTSHISERITVDRDVGCGIRFGMYMLASGLILARASGGDWTSLQATIVEFLVGWPVLPLAALVLLVEQYYLRRTNNEFSDANPIIASFFWGCVYIAYAIIAVLSLPPLAIFPR